VGSSAITVSLPETYEPEDWHLYARCLNVGDTELFFKPSKERNAKRLCKECPVVEACLTAALREEDGYAYRYGVRGGLNPIERRNLERRRFLERRRG